MTLIHETPKNAIDIRCSNPNCRKIIWGRTDARKDAKCFDCKKARQKQKYEWGKGRAGSKKGCA